MTMENYGHLFRIGFKNILEVNSYLKDGNNYYHHLFDECHNNKTCNNHYDNRLFVLDDGNIDKIGHMIVPQDYMKLKKKNTKSSIFNINNK